MKHVTIELTDAQQARLEEFAAQDGHASVRDYVAALIDADARAKAQERLEEMLLEGLRSPSLAWTPELMDEIRRAARSNP